MDYDDSDFQSQNLHIGGEGNIDCPPVLQPYSLPRFDFDEGRLRFDSLVESEVFLGIESSVANDWIEDFSREGSGIEFSSSAVDPCSISRRNDVWSEATSSESVEMLLKSVGQEEIVPARTVFVESDACIEEGCIKQMEPNLKNIRDLHCSTSLPDEIVGELSGVHSVGDLPQLEDASQTHGVELPVDGSSVVLDPNSIGGEDRLPVTKENLSDEKGNDVNNIGINNLDDCPPDSKMCEESSTSEMQVDNVINPVQNVIISSTEQNNQDGPHHMNISEENPSGHEASTDIPCSDELDKTLYPVSEVESVTVVQEAATILMKGDSILPTIGECSNSESSVVLAETKQCENTAVSKDADADCDQSTMTNTDNLVNTVGKFSPSHGSTLRGECSDKENPEVLNETKKCENNVSFKDNGGVSSNLNQKDCDYVTALHSSIVGVFSGLDPSLESNSKFPIVDSFSDEESPEVPADTNNNQPVASLRDTDIAGDQSQVHVHNLSAMTYGNVTEHAVEPNNSISSCVSPFSDLHKVDASDNKCSDTPAETTKCENIVLSKGTDTAGDESKLSPHVLALVAYRSDIVCPDNIRNSNSVISSILDLSLRMESEKNTEDDAMKIAGLPLESESLVRKSEASMTTIEEADVFEGRSDENHKGSSLAEIPSKVSVTGASKSVCDAVEVSAEELNVSLYNLRESTERCSDNVVYKECISGQSDLDLSSSEKDYSKSLIESNIMDTDLVGSVKGDMTSPVPECSVEKELFPAQKHGVDGSASVADVPLESFDPATCGTTDVVPLTSENCTTTHIHNVLVAPAAPSTDMRSQSDSKEENTTEISKDASVSCTESSPVVESGRVRACKAVDGTSCDSDGQLLGNTLDQSLPTSIGCNAEYQIESGAAVANDISKRSATDMEVKGGDDTDHDGAAAENNFTSEGNSGKSSKMVKVPTLSACLPESCSKSADPDRPGCGSSKAPRTAEISVTEHGTGNIKESTIQNAGDPDIVRDVSKYSSNSSNPTEANESQKYGTSDVTSFADLPIGMAANSSHPLPATSAPKIVEDPQTDYGSGRRDTKISEEISPGNREIASGGSKGSTKPKRRRVSTKGTSIKSAKKGTAKATTPIRQAERGNKSSSVGLGKSGIFPFAQPNDMQYYGVVESSSKTYPLLTTTSSVPDVKSSVPASLVFQQPFTDVQQVQLRAQILVYGALIQGTAPDESCMVSAYGGPDGGRSIWQNSWRMCMERLHSKKATPINLVTPVQTASGGRVPDQAVKESTLQVFQGPYITSPSGRASTKGNLPPASPIIPISSPLWSIPTPACEAPQYGVLPRGSVMESQLVHTPLHPFQTSPIGNIVGQNSSWMSQSSLQGPWVASPQTSAAEAHFRFSAFPNTEPVLLNHVKETTSVQVPSIKHPSIGSGQTGGITSVFPGFSPLLDTKKVGVASPGEPSSQPKSRKRKKVSDSKEPGQISLQPQSQPGSAIARDVMRNVSTSVTVTTPSTYVSYAMPEKLALSVSSDHLGLAQRATLSKETLNKAKEARQQAEEASAHAAAAVGHSQKIWSQLDKQKNSRLKPDTEAKLASSAVAVAAAAAVAKAAAAAAQVASNAAMQAILMAEEAYRNQSVSVMDLSTDAMNAMGLNVPGTIVRAEDGTNGSSSFVISAREAARQNIEATSSASKQAENMDAIVKAAELAAEAVSHAGMIVAMGDPLPLSDLAKAGPEGYWKAPLVSSEIITKSNEEIREQLNFSALGSEDSDKEETVGMITKSDYGNDFGKTAEASKNSIMEGSQVEVLKEGDGSAVGWFTATVLSLQHGNAHVCYTELESDEGSGKLQEWVALDSEEDTPPKIRVARLFTPSLEGTRKRRREAMAAYSWSIGDKVDAWIQNSWWEGVVMEKNKKDETILKVHFPAQGETSHVKAWHLRPSLIWKDGKWVEWSSLQNESLSMEDGMPQEKRIKLGSPAVEGKGKNKTLEDIGLDSGKPEEPKLLNLSANEKVFNIGKNTTMGNKIDRVRANRTGLQEEGSVKFGIPKPKRKFIEISKHYVTNQTNKAADNKLRGFRSERQRKIPKDNFSTDLVSAADRSNKLDHTRQIKDSVRQADGLSGKRSIFETGSSYSSDGRAQGAPKFSSSARSERSNKGNIIPAVRKLGKIEENKVTSSNPANSTSEVIETRRSNRRIQPTSRLLEGLQSLMSISRIPSVSHGNGPRSQNRNASRGGDHD